MWALKRFLTNILRPFYEHCFWTFFQKFDSLGHVFRMPEVLPDPQLFCGSTKGFAPAILLIKISKKRLSSRESMCEHEVQKVLTCLYSCGKWGQNSLLHFATTKLCFATTKCADLWKKLKKVGKMMSIFVPHVRTYFYLELSLFLKFWTIESLERSL